MKKFLAIIFSVPLLTINFNVQADETFFDLDGNNHSCLEDNIISSTVEECNKCDNRLLASRSFRDSRKNCYPCSYSKNVFTNDEECSKCSNREMKEIEILRNCGEGESCPPKRTFKRKACILKSSS